MSLQSFIPWLVVLIVITVATSVIAASDENASVSAASAAAFAFAAIYVAVRANAPFWATWENAPGDDDVATAARRNARLMAIAFAWGAATLFAVYTLTPLVWQHGWQYALAMTVLSVGLFIYAVMMEADGSVLRQPRIVAITRNLTGLQFLIAIGAIVYLLAADKFSTRKGDWAANYVFASVAVTIAMMSVIAILTQYAMNKAQEHPHSS